MNKSIIYFVLIMVVFSVVCQSLTILKLQDKITVLQEQQQVDKELADGMDRHLQFVDSDHAKLGNDLANLRQDFDTHRYHSENAEER
jgi:hypothetical protein